MRHALKEVYFGELAASHGMELRLYQLKAISLKEKLLIQGTINPIRSP